MGNTISSNLVPRIIGEARETLSETMALLKNVNHDFSNASMQKGQTVSIGIPATLTAAAISAANTAPAPSDITNNYASVTVDQFYKASFAYTRKEDTEYEISSLFLEQLREAVRAVAYKVNSTLWARYYQIPHYSGTSGTALFYTGSAYTLGGLATIKKVLDNNKVPLDMRSMAMTVSDYHDLIQNTTLVNVNQAGSSESLREGMASRLFGLNLYEDHQVPSHTVGTVTGDPTAGATSAGVSSVTLTTDGDDAVALKQGDIITFGDGYYYAAQADVTIGNSDTGTLTLDRGLDAALAGTENPTVVTTTGPQNIAGDFRGFSVVARSSKKASCAFEYELLDPFPFPRR